MTFSVTMPALGESVSEGTVTRWLKAEGDHIAVDEPLLEVSTDKVDTEIPSPIAGVLQKIVVGVDQTVPVGAELAIIADSAGASAPAPASAAPVVINVQQNQENKQQVKQGGGTNTIIKERVVEKPVAAPVKAEPKDEEPW